MASICTQFADADLEARKDSIGQWHYARTSNQWGREQVYGPGSSTP